MTLERKQALGFTFFRELFLVRQVQSSALTHDYDFTVGELVRAIVAVGQNPAVCLTVHRFRTQSRGSQKHLLTSQRCEIASEAFIVHSHLDEQVFLRSDAFTRSSVVVGARLSIDRRVHGETLRLHNLTNLLKRIELPANERIVERIRVGGDERTSPVDLTSHGDDVALRQRRKIIQPMHRFREARNFLIWDPTRLHDRPLRRLRPLFRRRFRFLRHKLCRVRRSRVRRLRLRLFLRLCLHHARVGKHGRVPIRRNLLRNLIRARLDRHPRAMKRKRKQRAIALQPVRRARKLQLTQRERVPQMQQSVHVRIRKVSKILFPPSLALARARRVHLERFFPRPLPLRATLQLEQQVASRRVLSRLRHRVRLVRFARARFRSSRSPSVAARRVVASSSRDRRVGRG